MKRIGLDIGTGDGHNLMRTGVQSDRLASGTFNPGNSIGSSVRSGPALNVSA